MQREDSGDFLFFLVQSLENNQNKTLNDNIMLLGCISRGSKILSEIFKLSTKREGTTLATKKYFQNSYKIFCYEIF